MLWKVLFSYLREQRQVSELVYIKILYICIDLYILTIKLNNCVTFKLLYMKLNLNDKDIMHAMGLPFYPFAKWFGIELDETDLDYIVNVIRKDKCFPLIMNAYMSERAYFYKLSNVTKAYAQINVIVFFDKFYNASDCPKGVKLILFVILGLYRDFVANLFPNLLAERYIYVERWLETVI